MSYSAGQPPNGLHLLGLKELLLQPPSLGNIKHVALELDQLAVAVKYANSILYHIKRRAVPAPELGFDSLQPAVYLQSGQQFLPDFRIRIQGPCIAFQCLLDRAESEHAGKSRIAGHKPPARTRDVVAGQAVFEKLSELGLAIPQGLLDSFAFRDIHPDHQHTTLTAYLYRVRGNQVRANVAVLHPQVHLPV